MAKEKKEVKKKDAKTVDVELVKVDIHELTIRVENAEAKADECYKKMNRALEQLNKLTTLLPKIQKCCDRLGI